MSDLDTAKAVKDAVVGIGTVLGTACAMLFGALAVVLTFQAARDAFGDRMVLLAVTVCFYVAMLLLRQWARSEWPFLKPKTGGDA